MKYTMLINHAEYAYGLFDTIEDAEKLIAIRIRQDEPDVSDDMSDEYVIENFDSDGYYRVLEIYNVGDDD